MHNIECFVAGSSGGHIIPLITKAQAVLEAHHTNKILFFSSTSPLDKTILERSLPTGSCSSIFLSCAKLPKQWWNVPFFMAKLVVSMATIFFHLIKTRPNSITSTGGLISLPVCIVGFILRIPIHLIELNVVPGKSIIFLARLATKIFICFKETAHFLPKNQCLLTHYPLRPALIKEFNNFTLPTIHKKILLVLGGSQGSVFLNNIIVAWARQLDGSAKNNLIIMHQVGNQTVQPYQQKYQELGIEAHVFSFDPALGKRYKQASLIICRAGAGTLFEIAHMQKPCITIPLITQETDHQQYNAQAMNHLYPFIATMNQSTIEHDATTFFSALNTMFLPANHQV